MKIFGFITRMSLTGIFTVVKNMCLKRFCYFIRKIEFCSLVFFYFQADIKLNIKLNRCRTVFFEWRQRTVVLDLV